MQKLSKAEKKCAICSEVREVKLQEEMTFYTCCSETSAVISVLYCKKCKELSLRSD